MSVYFCIELGNCPRNLHDLVFFFQAEDGIRDRNVTGVQTCALPILPPSALCSPSWSFEALHAEKPKILEISGLTPRAAFFGCCCHSVWSARLFLCPRVWCKTSGHTQPSISSNRTRPRSRVPTARLRRKP